MNSAIMSSNSKRQKLSKELYARQRKDEAIGSPLHKRFEDRLTNLPNSLRTKILSCLSTKDAVKTSILSKGWRRSWTSVTNLDFDDNFVRHPCDNDDFTNFVNRVLLLCDRSCLQMFRMKCSKKHCKGSLINAWIAAALLGDIKEIDLSVGAEDGFFRTKPSCLLPFDLFICKTLVVLKLDTRSSVNIPASVSLPGLKTLHITHVKLSDDVSIANLFSGCPVLEDLLLSRCVRKDACAINIISPSLTSLTIDYLSYDYSCHITPGDFYYQIIIDTPSLRYLNFSDYAVEGYTLKNMNHLIKAEIDVGFPYHAEEEFTDEFVELHSKPITDLFVGISQVQSLVLSDESTKAIYWCDVAFPTFSNLTYLELNNVPEELLENTPCLEPLYIRKGTPYKIDEFGQREYERYLSVDDMPPSCFLSHLRVIKIGGFRSPEYKMQFMHMVEYILKNAKVLEKLTLKYQSFCVDDAKQLLMLPRCSAICKVEIL